MDRALLCQKFFNRLCDRYPLPADLRVTFMPLEKDFIYIDKQLMSGTVTMASSWAILAVAIGFGSEDSILNSTAHEYKHLLQEYVEKTFPKAKYLPENHPLEVEARAFGKAEAAKYLNDVAALEIVSVSA
jgi:hypothetical protein